MCLVCDSELSPPCTRGLSAATDSRWARHTDPGGERMWQPPQHGSHNHAALTTRVHTLSAGGNRGQTSKRIENNTIVRKLSQKPENTGQII